MSDKEQLSALVKEVLGEELLVLRVDTIQLTENLECGKVELNCTVHHAQNGKKWVISGQGVGIIDALFSALISMNIDKYPSLGAIRFTDFGVSVNLATGHSAALSDSNAEVFLRVKNSREQLFTFTDTSPSLTRSSVYVVLFAVAFFINCECAYRAVHKALLHAQKNGRSDSIAQYTSQLAILVEATSYSSIIDDTTS